MSDQQKTKQHLLDELNHLRRRVSDLERILYDQESMRESLRKSKEQYRQLVESTTDWIWETDIQHRCVYTNKQVKTILGYEPEDILGKSPTDFMTRHDADVAWPVLDRLKTRPDAPYGIESSQLHKDGSIRYLEINIVPIFNPDGSHTGFRGVTRNITARKKIEQNLKEAEERFRLVSQAANDAIYDWNVATGTLWLSEPHRKFLSFPEKEDHYGWWKSHLHPADRQRIVSGLRFILKGLSSSWMSEYRFLCEDGRYISIVDRGQIIRDENGTPLRIVGSMMDVTHRKLAEEAIANSEENYRRLIEDSPIAMIVYGPDGAILMANKRSLVVLGSTENFILGKSHHADWWLIKEDGTPLPLNESPLLQAIRLQVPIRDKVYGISYPDTKDICWYLVSAQPQWNKSGQLLRIVSSFIDISENIRMQKAVVESEAKFRFLTEKMSDVVWTMDIHMNLSYLSPSIKRALGYEREELLGKPAAHIMAQESLVAAMALLAKQLERNRHLPVDQESAVTFDAAVYHKDASLVWFENIISFIRNNKGKIVGLYGVSRNITEHKQDAEEKEQLISELKQVLSEVKTLSGLLPICSHCKKIRDDKGYWNQLESYISEHSEAFFSHGLCPECVIKLYPELLNKKHSP